MLIYWNNAERNNLKTEDKEGDKKDGEQTIRQDDLNLYLIRTLHDRTL